LMNGKGEKPSLTSTSRFKDAFKKLPPAENSMTFLDANGLIDGIRSMLDRAARETKNDEQAQGVLKALKAALGDLALVDYSAETSRTEGMRVFSDSWTALAPDAKKRGAYSMFVTGGEIEKFDKYIPKEAVDFSVSTGIDWKAAYGWIRKFVREQIPEGDSAWE